MVEMKVITEIAYVPIPRMISRWSILDIAMLRCITYMKPINLEILGCGWEAQCHSGHIV